MGQFIKFNVVSDVSDSVSTPDINGNVTLPWKLEAVTAWVQDIDLVISQTNDTVTIENYASVPAGYGKLKLESTIYLYAGGPDQIAPKNPADPLSSEVLWIAAAEKGVTVVQSIDNFENKVVRTSANGLNFSLAPELSDLSSNNPEFVGQLVQVWNDAGQKIISGITVHQLYRGMSYTLNMQKNIDPLKEVLTNGDPEPLVYFKAGNQAPYYNAPDLREEDNNTPIPFIIGPAPTISERRRLSQAKGFTVTYTDLPVVPLSSTQGIIAKIPSFCDLVPVSAPLPNDPVVPSAYRISTYTFADPFEGVYALNLTNAVALAPFLKTGMSAYLQNLYNIPGEKGVEDTRVTILSIDNDSFGNIRVKVAAQRPEAFLGTVGYIKGLLQFDIRFGATAQQAKIKSFCISGENQWAFNSNLRLYTTSHGNSKLLKAEIVDGSASFLDTEFKPVFSLVYNDPTLQLPQRALQRIFSNQGLVLDVTEYETAAGSAASEIGYIYNVDKNAATLGDLATDTCRSLFSTLRSNTASDNFVLTSLTTDIVNFTYSDDNVSQIVVNGDSRDIAKSVQLINPQTGQATNAFDTFADTKYNATSAKIINHILVSADPRTKNWVQFYSSPKTTVEFVLLDSDLVPVCGNLIQLNHPDYTGRLLVTQVTQSELSIKIKCQVQNVT